MNATEMAKSFEGKKVGNFLRGKDILEYINALHESKSLSQIRATQKSPLISIESRNSGTWLQENIALRFAQWLNPKFSVWCDQRIKEIMNKGFSPATEEATEYLELQMDTKEMMINDISECIPRHLLVQAFSSPNHLKFGPFILQDHFLALLPGTLQFLPLKQALVMIKL